LYLALNHLPPTVRLAAAAAEWKAVRGTDGAVKFHEEARGCKKLTEATSEDNELACSKRGVTLRKKMLKLVIFFGLITYI